MFSLSLISFQTPLALSLLVFLPVIWWLLRITPPRPFTVSFPPVRFLLDLKDRLNTPDKSPWWLTALRILLAAILIIALAGPTLNPTAQIASGNGPVLIILDDGWAAARAWPNRLAAIDNITAEALRARRSVILATTTPALTPPKFELQSPTRLRATIKTLKPQPLTPDRKTLIAALEAKADTLKITSTFWLSDGLDYGQASDFAARLMKLPNSTLTVLQAKAGSKALAVTQPSIKGGTLTVNVTRAQKTGARSGLMRAVAENGRTLADLPFSFADGKTQASAKLNLPLALRNQVARLEIEGEKSASAVFLLDDRWRQKAIGLATSNVRDAAQPLLSAMHYVTRALEPKAALRLAKPKTGSSGVQQLLKAGLSALILADIGKLQPDDERAVSSWIERGGILVRFAGPRLASSNDTLVPVKLRRGDRALGGVLSWSKAQKLSSFDETSPFFGLTIPKDITISRQVLAEPSGLAGAKIWARLEDGTPLVTAANKGQGLVVLFHVPSSPGWSNLPLSGLFVEMLHKLADLAPIAIGDDETRLEAGVAQTNQPLGPRKVLDGFGQLENPAAYVEPLTAEGLKRNRIGPRHPPGLYGPQNGARALNIGTNDLKLTTMGKLPDGIDIKTYGPTRIVNLKPALLITAFLLFLADGLAVFALSGGLGALARPGTVAAIMLGLFLTASDHANAQSTKPEAPQPPGQQQSTNQNLDINDRFALAATQKTKLAYVMTGRPAVDNVSLAGLAGLSSALTNRTSFEPGSPIGVNIERDELTFFPLLYWPVTSATTLPSPKAIAKIDAYMKRGGTVLFDTLDHQQSTPSADGSVTSPNSQRLRQLLSKFDIPALEVIPANHVITKAFYLQQDFPGRWAGGRLWVEAAQKQNGTITPTSKGHDGVSSIIIGSNNYAAAWAQDNNGRAMFPVVPGGDRQREMAFRTGVNIVMYVLTGNYKADQVHIPSLLERLGQ